MIENMIIGGCLFNCDLRQTENEDVLMYVFTNCDIKAAWWRKTIISSRYLDLI